MKCVPDAQRGAHVLVAVQEECRHLHMGSTSRRSAVHARAIARNPAGWNSVSEAANSSTLSLVAAVENIVGSIVAMNSAGAAATPAGSVRAAVRHPLTAATRPIRRTRWREPSSTPSSDGADKTQAQALHRTTAQSRGHAPGRGR
jgi:hypothetical protein